MNFLALKLEERRKKKLRQIYWNFCEDFGLLLWAIAICGVGVVATLLWGMWPR